MVARYEECRSVYSLAQEFGTTRQTAAAILERHGVKRHYNVLTGEAISKAARLYDIEGWSLAKLGDEFNVAAKTIQMALVRAGIAMRPVGTNQWR